MAGASEETDIHASALRMEIPYVECTVEGTLPNELQGAFFRLGGRWYYPPKFSDDIPLHADGFMSMFRIQDGRVGYAGRFVETDRLRANREKGRMRFGYYRNRITDDPDVAGINASAANTAAFAFAGKLLALKEDSLPYEIDPVTLETIGMFDFGGAFRSKTFTAHPKVDGGTGELVTFGYQAEGPLTEDVFLYVIAPDGTVRNEIRIKVPWLDMIHDIAITRDHILLPLGGFAVDRDRLADGGALWQWDPGVPARIGILRRDGDGSDLRWFTGPKRCLLHTFNAFESGTKIVLDAPFYRGNPFPFLRSVDGSPWHPSFGEAVVRRLTFDPASSGNAWKEEVLFDTIIGDLGDVDPRKMGDQHRYCFSGHELPRAEDEKEASFARPPWPISNSYVRFDIQERAMEMLRLPSHVSLGECVFVPRSPSSPEGDGFLIGVGDDLIDQVSHLIVADASNLEAGPVATARLPFQAGPQVHGCWVFEGEMKLRDLP